MCGITGFVRPGGLAPGEGESIGRAMRDVLVHRGPDDSGVWVECRYGVVLAHRRLSIVDLSSAGHQPMFSPSQRYVIILNGEIYNHDCLRRRVEEKSERLVNWRGTSDTEVLLAAIDRFGVEETLNQVVGMFAFVLWDRRDKTLYLARDRIGEKPLYYGWQDRDLLFGSELKSFRVHPSFIGAIDESTIPLFLRYGYVPSPWSIFRGVEKVPPATILRFEVESGAFVVNAMPVARQYWSLHRVVENGLAKPFTGDENEAVDELDGLLATVIDLQTKADVPLGAFLSGGVDSSTILSLMQSRSLQAVKTFTIGFSDPSYNEADSARAIAEHLGTDHTERYVSPEDARDVIPRLPSLYDEPFADCSQIPTVLMCSLAREDVTVVLSGDGGDEVFGGYDRYFRLLRFWGIHERVPFALRSPSVHLIQTIVGSGLRGGRLRTRLRTLANILDAPSPEILYRYCVSGWKRPSDIMSKSEAASAAIEDVAYWPTPGDLQGRLMAIDTITYLPDDVLVKVDRAAMGVGLETRVPFLDHRILEFAWRLPPHFKMRDGAGKWILRRVLGRYIPPQLYERPKRGFGIPLASWLRGPLREWAESLLQSHEIGAIGIFDGDVVRRTWHAFLGGRDDLCTGMWTILMFQAWRAESMYSR